MSTEEQMTHLADRLEQLLEHSNTVYPLEEMGQMNQNMETHYMSCKIRRDVGHGLSTVRVSLDNINTVYEGVVPSGIAMSSCVRPSRKPVHGSQETDKWEDGAEGRPFHGFFEVLISKFNGLGYRTCQFPDGTRTRVTEKDLALWWRLGRNSSCGTQDTQGEPNKQGQDEEKNIP